MSKYHRIIYKRKNRNFVKKVKKSSTIQYLVRKCTVFPLFPVPIFPPVYSSILQYFQYQWPPYINNKFMTLLIFFINKTKLKLITIIFFNFFSLLQYSLRYTGCLSYIHATTWNMLPLIPTYVHVARQQLPNYPIAFGRFIHLLC